MKKSHLYGEILYIGLVAEKGRVFGQLWRSSYRKTLRIHIALWQKIIKRMIVSDYREEDEQLVMEFIELCKKRNEIGKYYKTLIDSFSELEQKVLICAEKVPHSQEEKVIINFMNDLVIELTELLKPRMLGNRNKIYLTIRALHNLPRIFLSNSQAHIYGLNNVASTFHDVIEFSFSNMDQEMQNRFIKYKNI